VRSAEEIADQANGLEFSTDHAEQWKNDCARDLNRLLGRIVFQLETDGDEEDCAWAEATIRLVFRVAGFEEIQRKGGAA
jgi:hypothetical protein